MDKQAIYDYLNRRNISYEVTEHKAVYNMAELAEVVLPYADVLAKNLFVHDDKKRSYYLITIKGEKRINLKNFRWNNGTRPLTFADEHDLMVLLGLVPGSVTPLGLLNDKECRVHLFLDKEFLTTPAIIGVHPNDNTATVWLRTDDLIQIIKEHGNEVHIIEIKNL